MTVSDVVSILVRAEVVEMPCVYYLTEIRHPDGLPALAADDFWRCTVPDGKKLVVRKVGVSSFESAHASTDKALITTGDGRWYEYAGVYNEPNLEFKSGTFVVFYAYNKGNEPSKFGVWFLFDFEPE